jgi:Uncharacterised nucleotidyltransferase
MSMSGSRADRDAAVRLLGECVRVDRPLDPEATHRLVARTTPPSLVDAAAYHRVSGLVLARLEAVPDLPREVLPALRTRYDEAVRNHLRLTFELGRLRGVLDSSGARWAVVKGPAAVALLYDDPGLRPYGDIDVIVEPGRFDRVLEALASGGSTLLDRNWEVMRRDLLGELHYLLPGGAPLDLHWNLVNMYRGRIRIDTAGLLERSEPVEMGGVTAPTPDAVDSLLHLALHGTLSGADRLLWMSDVARAASRRRPDWDELIRRAEEWHVAAPVGLMLARASSVLGAEVPAAVPDRLLGRSYRALLPAVDRVSPWQRARGRLRTPSLLLARSMGLGVPGAARWLIGRTIRSFDPREPEASSTFTPRGDQRDYEAFVRAVVESGSA